MKISSKLTLIILIFSLLSCGGKDEKKEDEKITIGDYNKTEKVKEPISEAGKPIPIGLNRNSLFSQMRS